MNAIPSPGSSNLRAKCNTAGGRGLCDREPQASHSYYRVRVMVRYCGELLVDLVIRLPAAPPWSDDEQGIGGGR
jgi:hypothetical protein